MNPAAGKAAPRRRPSLRSHADESHRDPADETLGRFPRRATPAMSVARLLILQLRCGAGALGLVLGATLVSGAIDAPVATTSGLPLMRTYSFEEIGNVSPGLRLASDALGRLTAVQEGIYIVFDGENWSDVMEKGEPNGGFAHVALGPDGVTYCGAAGSWGYLHHNPSGRVSVHSLRPARSPE